MNSSPPRLKLSPLGGVLLPKEHLCSLNLWLLFLVAHAHEPHEVATLMPTPPEGAATGGPSTESPVEWIAPGPIARLFLPDPHSHGVDTFNFKTPLDAKVRI